MESHHPQLKKIRQFDTVIRKAHDKRNKLIDEMEANRVYTEENINKILKVNASAEGILKDYGWPSIYTNHARDQFIFTFHWSFESPEMHAIAMKAIQDILGTSVPPLSLVVKYLKKP